MSPAELMRAIENLEDDQAERCLQVLIKGYAVRHGAEELYASESLLSDIVTQYQYLILESKQKELPRPTVGPTPPPVSPPPIPSPRPEVTDPTAWPITTRELLREMAGDAELRPHLESWFEFDRPTLFDPITAALVLGGIVLVLSTEIDIKVSKDKDGKIEWKVQLKKPPT